MKKLKDWFTSLIRSLPLLSGLPDCKWIDHRKAFSDLSIAVLFSTATFWLSALLLTLYSEEGFFELLRSTVQHGEPLIFALGFLGPALVLALEEGMRGRQFPGRRSHVISLIVLAIISSAFYASVHTARQEQFAVDFAQKLRTGYLVTVSLWIAAFAIFLRYLAIVYRRSLAEPADLKTQERDFLEQFGQHRSGK